MPDQQSTPPPREVTDVYTVAELRRSNYAPVWTREVFAALWPDEPAPVFPHGR